MGPKKVWVPKKFWAHRNVGSKKVGSKKLWVEKILGQNEFWVTKKSIGPNQSVGLKRFWVRKNYVPKEILGLKKIRFKKLFEKNLGFK